MEVDLCVKENINQEGFRDEELITKCIFIAFESFNIQEIKKFKL